MINKLIQKKQKIKRKLKLKISINQKDKFYKQKLKSQY